MKKLLTLLLVGSACTLACAQKTEDTLLDDRKIEIVGSAGVPRPEPLYIQSNEGVKDELSKKEFEELTKNTQRIKSISVLNDEKAVLLYGERAKNGVIIVEMKPHLFSLPVEPTKNDR